MKRFSFVLRETTPVNPEEPDATLIVVPSTKEEEEEEDGPRPLLEDNDGSATPKVLAAPSQESSSAAGLVNLVRFQLDEVEVANSKDGTPEFEEEEKKMMQEDQIDNGDPGWVGSNSIQNGGLSPVNGARSSTGSQHSNDP